MSRIKETREFFLRDFKKNHGKNKDNELGFPILNKVKRLVIKDGVVTEKYANVYNRFLEGHVPSSDVWAKLLESVVFHTDMIFGENGTMIDTVQELYDTVLLEGGLRDRLLAIEKDLHGDTDVIEDIGLIDAVFNIQSIIGDIDTDNTVIWNINGIFERLNQIDIILENLELGGNEPFPDITPLQQQVDINTQNISNLTAGASKELVVINVNSANTRANINVANGIYRIIVDSSFGQNTVPIDISQNIITAGAELLIMVENNKNASITTTFVRNTQTLQCYSVGLNKVHAKSGEDGVNVQLIKFEAYPTDNINSVSALYAAEYITFTRKGDFGDDPDLNPDPGIFVSVGGTTTMTVGSDEDTVTIGVQSNGTWDVATDVAWISISGITTGLSTEPTLGITTGTGSATVFVVVEKNTAITNRTGRVTVTTRTGSKTAYMDITQEGL